MRRLLPIWLFAFVAACSGSDDPNLTEKFQLRARADAYENHMPGVIFPGEPPSCTQLIVVFVVASPVTPLPLDFSAELVSLGKQNSIDWKAEVSASETGLTDERTLQGVARGCKTEAFNKGDELDVVIRVKTNDTKADVKATAKLFYAS
jgi:hypothetical protein